MRVGKSVLQISDSPVAGRLRVEQDSWLSTYGRYPAGTKYWSKVLVGDETEELLDDHDLIVTIGPLSALKYTGEDLAIVRGSLIEHDSRLVFPMRSPAAGVAGGDIEVQTALDYRRLAQAIKGDIEPTRDEYPDPGYRQVGVELDEYLTGSEVVAIDTEGYLDNPWSIQFSVCPGTGVVVLREDPYFADIMEWVQQWVRDADPLVVMHNSMHDYAVCRKLGLELRDTRLYDTMYAAYLTRTEPQSLKALARRWCGVVMEEYESVTGGAGRERQLEYLRRVVGEEWGEVEPRAVYGNDGSVKIKKPTGLARRAKSILKSQPEDVWAAWHKTDSVLLAECEARLGKMERGGLQDVPIEDAILYSCRDADVTLRLWLKFDEVLDADMKRLMGQGMEFLPIIEEMQSTGMPASRSYFENFKAELDDDLMRMQAQLSSEFYGGKAFNPKSPKHVGNLVRRRGLKGLKTTSTGAMSTNKKSIEYLKYTDPAIKLVFEWREKQHIRDSFCKVALANFDPHCADDIQPIRCTLKATRTATRRLASTDPNLLAVPSRSKVGIRVRSGYRCPPGEMLGAWDLSQIEMRFLAHMSGDQLLCDRFRSGADIHSETAAAIFGVPVAEVGKVKHRLPAKTAGFGIVYGIQGPGLLDQLRGLGLDSWDVDSAGKLIEGWLQVYGGVAEYIEKVKRDAGRVGWVKDPWGMVRYLPGIWSGERWKKAEAEREAVSHTIQGGAQGMIQRSMAWLRPVIREMQLAGMNVKWVLQIHDEIVLQFEEGLWDVLNEIVLHALTKECGIELAVPVEAEGNGATDWGGLK